MDARLDAAIEKVYANVHLEEGIGCIKHFLEEVFFREGISVKELANALSLPVPVVSAVKGELKKNGLVLAQNGIRLTDAGRTYVEENLGYGSINREAFLHILETPLEALLPEFGEELEMLTRIYEGRPEVDVTLDQSKCTAETGIQRGIFLLQSKSLVGRQFLFLGDDDLTSVAAALVLRHVTKPGCRPDRAHITVFDVDERILGYIEGLAKELGADIRCVQHDLRLPLPEEKRACYDGAATDPPYTLDGLRLFLSRGISALKRESDLPFYLSFAHKGPLVQLDMQRLFVDSGMVVSEIHPKFNRYDGAQMIGGVSDLTVLRTTQKTVPMLTEEYRDKIYTGEFRTSVRTYQCRACREKIRVGMKEEIKTVEALKAAGCPRCGAKKFDLYQKDQVENQ